MDMDMDAEALKARFYIDQTMDEGEVRELPGGVAAVYSRRGPNHSERNEDAAALLPVDEESSVLVVADGVGGLQAGNQASDLAIRELSDSLERARKGEEGLREAILNGIEQANEAIVALGIGAATTLSLALLQQTTVRTFHVGDSMILLTGQRGKLKLQTVNHSPVGYAVEAGFLDEEQALHHDDLHLISNMVGSSEMRIEIGPECEMAPRDTLLLATDGLFDNLFLEEIVEDVRKGPLKHAVQTVAARCQDRMIAPRKGYPSKQDDVTFILYRRG